MSTIGWCWVIAGATVAVTAVINILMVRGFRRTDREVAAIMSRPEEETCSTTSG
jgi:hypothetical protein